MSHHQKGLVLFTVIVLLAILTTLVLSLLQTVFLYTEASNQVAKRHQLFYQIEAAANQLQSLDESTVDDQCKVYGKASNDVMNLLNFYAI